MSKRHIYIHQLTNEDLAFLKDLKYNDGGCSYPYGSQYACGKCPLSIVKTHPYPNGDNCRMDPALTQAEFLLKLHAEALQEVEDLLLGEENE